MSGARPAPRRRGFTLVEILFTVVILGIVIIPITRLIIFSVFGTEKTKDYVVAFHLAKRKMETLRLVPFDALENESNDLWTEEELSRDPDAEEFRKGFLARYGFDHAPCDGESARFEREVRIDPSADKIHKDSRLKKITVAVRRKGGGEELCALVTLRSRN